MAIFSTLMAKPIFEIWKGNIGRFCAQAIRAMTEATLHSVYNHRPAAAESFANKFGVISYSDCTEILTDPELEIITIATPSGVHFETAIAALSAARTRRHGGFDLL